MTLPEKEGFYSHLSMEEITDADYTHRHRAFKDSEIKKLLYKKDKRWKKK